MAGISKIIEPISVGEKLGRRDSYPLFAQVCDWTHRQGGIAGWAHGGSGIKLHESLPVEAALGKLDFIESIQFNRWFGFYFWYRLLNCGLRLATTGGSDFPFSATLMAPWYPNLGLDRTYVPLDTRRPFTYDAYIEAIRRWRTIATNGPLLTLDVGGHGPGKVLHSRGRLAPTLRQPGSPARAGRRSRPSPRRVQSLSLEFLDHVLIFGMEPTRLLVGENSAVYDTVWPHQWKGSRSLGAALPGPRVFPPAAGKIKCQTWLGEEGC